MTFQLNTGDWWLVASGVTVVYAATMYWCMPTPKAKLRMFLAPLVGWLYLVPNAAFEGYSVPQTLYFYSSALMTFVIMLAPIAKKVAADIKEQEEKPWDNVPVNTFSLYWMIGSATACIAGVAYFWPILV
ncbi:hypothetical protein ACGH7X_20365 [Streptomyces sp. BBFR51]|uniref:hypothetical protein n=1 Tax=Streptomyces sp. BBFR51 TaxID=3372856 RepID=UPI0037DC9E9F